LQGCGSRKAAGRFDADVPRCLRHRDRTPDGAQHALGAVEERRPLGVQPGSFLPATLFIARVAYLVSGRFYGVGRSLAHSICSAPSDGGEKRTDQFSLTDPAHDRESLDIDNGDDGGAVRAADGTVKFIWEPPQGYEHVTSGHGPT
jgi:hypothetical protein